MTTDKKDGRFGEVAGGNPGASKLLSVNENFETVGAESGTISRDDWLCRLSF